MDLLNQSSLLVAVVSFALGASVLTRNVKNKLFLSFALVCGLMSGWALFFFLDRVVGMEAEESGFYRIHLLFNLWLAPAVIALIRVMTRLGDTWSRRLQEFSLVGAVLLTAALLLDLDTLPAVRGPVLFFPFLVLVQIAR